MSCFLKKKNLITSPSVPNLLLFRLTQLFLNESRFIVFIWYRESMNKLSASAACCCCQFRFNLPVCIPNINVTMFLAVTFYITNQSKTNSQFARLVVYLSTHVTVDGRALCHVDHTALTRGRATVLRKRCIVFCAISNLAIEQPTAPRKH